MAEAADNNNMRCMRTDEETTPFPELVHQKKINVILDGNNSQTPHVLRAVPLPASSSSASNNIRQKNNAPTSAFHTELTPDIPTVVVAENTHTHIFFCQISANVVYICNTFLRKPSFFLIFKTSFLSHPHVLHLFMFYPTPSLHFSSAER